jgi:DNA (cytosine-5)-methyltransferase 1
VIDVFCGAGGLSLGAARAGFTVLGAVDLDKDAIEAHKRNFPTSVHLQRNVARMSGATLSSEVGLANGELAGLVGGPPCQGFSVIGARDESDARNRLFVHFFRLVAEMRPKFFLAENVPGVMYAAHGKLVKSAMSQVAGHYSILPPLKVAARQYGAPTSRTRIFFIGYLPEHFRPLTIEDFSPPARVRSVHVKEALKGLPGRISQDWQSEDQGWRTVQHSGRSYYGSRLRGHVPPGVGDIEALRRLRRERLVSGCLGTAHSAKVARRYERIEAGRRDPVSRSPRLRPDGFCPTLRAGTGFDHGRFQAVRPLHPTQARVITPREAARLQGFPDWYQFAPSKWHSFRQIGSSVSPIVAERLLAAVRSALVNNGRGGR